MGTTKGRAKGGRGDRREKTRWRTEEELETVYVGGHEKGGGRREHPIVRSRRDSGWYYKTHSLLTSAMSKGRRVSQ